MRAAASPTRHAEPPEPLAPRWTRDAARPDVRRFEITSRGDRVSGRLVVPTAAAQPAPLVLVVGEGAPGDAEVFAGAGLAAAILDAPLCGARRSPKWSERLDAVLSRGPAAPDDALLFAAFRDQGAWDLGRVADAAAAVPGVAARRVGLAARGAGSWLAAPWLAADPRAGAAVLAPGAGDPAWDPADALAARPAVPLLLLRTGPGDRAEAWHAVAAPPREIADPSEDADPAEDAPAAVWAAAARFLAGALG